MYFRYIEYWYKISKNLCFSVVVVTTVMIMNNDCSLLTVPHWVMLYLLFST